MSERIKWRRRRVSRYFIQLHPAFSLSLTTSSIITTGERSSSHHQLILLPISGTSAIQSSGHRNYRYHLPSHQHHQRRELPSCRDSMIRVRFPIRLRSVPTRRHHFLFDIFHSNIRFLFINRTRPSLRSQMDQIQDSRITILLRTPPQEIQPYVDHARNVSLTDY